MQSKAKAVPPSARAEDATVLMSNPLSRAGGWLSAGELAAITPAVLKDRMTELKPLVAARSRQTEDQRHIDDEVFAKLRQSGIFYYFVPKRFGGLGFDVSAYIDVVLPLGEACASTGWVTSFCMEHNWLLAHFPEQAQKEIFARFPYVIAPGATMPPGAAKAVDGGYMVTGRWKWGTGVMHADWALLTGAVRPAPDAPPALLLLAVPIEEVSIHDAWHIDGMAGTGSHDIVAKEVFVPAHRAVEFAAIGTAASPGVRLHEESVYRMPTSAFLALTAAIPAVGNARGAVELCRSYLKERLLYGSASSRADRPSAQIKLALSDLDATSATLLLRDVAARLIALSHREQPPTVEERVNLRSQIAHAVDLSRQAIGRLMEVAGTSAHFLDNPLQRAFRDAHVMASHVALDLDSAAEQRGRLMIGLPPNSVIV